MAQFVNNNGALTYLPLLPFLPPLTINGMCYALRTDRLRALGGFAPLLHKLTDDLAMARSLSAQSARLFQSNACVLIQTHTPSITRYCEQMHRWFLFATLLLRGERPAMQALIGILHGIPPLLLWSLLACALIQPIGAAGGLAAAQPSVGGRPPDRLRRAVAPSACCLGARRAGRVPRVGGAWPSMNAAGPCRQP